MPVVDTWVLLANVLHSANACVIIGLCAYEVALVYLSLNVKGHLEVYPGMDAVDTKADSEEKDQVEAA